MDPLALQQQAVLARRHWARREAGLFHVTVTVVEARQRGGTPTNEHVYELCFVCDLSGKPLREVALKAWRSGAALRSP